MPKNLLKTVLLVFLFSSCVSASRNGKHSSDNDPVNTNVAELNLPDSIQPASLMDLPQTENGGFVLAPGYYEAEFKTYCLQPGTPDPSPRDAYLQAPVSGYRKDMVQTVLYNSRNRPEIKQRNVQLLLWCIVSKSDYNNLSPAVKADAARLLNPKQIFELKGGVMGVVKTVSYNLPVNGNNDIRRLFELGTDSYEAFEKMAVLREPSKLKRADYKNDQWYKEHEYYIRYFPVSYQKVRIQVYVPDGVIDSAGKISGKYLVFDPTGLQAIPANSNAQRLGIGGTVLDIVRTVIKINNANAPPARIPENKKVEKKVSEPVLK